jgi:hypothetical protein
MEVKMTPRDGQRFAAALLIPIQDDAVNGLVHQATRGNEFDSTTLTAALAAEGD